MVWKKILRYCLASLATILILVIVFVAVSVGPVDRTSIRESPAYQQLDQRIAQLDSLSVPDALSGFKVGYAVVNLTPSSRTATAGYGNRRGKHFTTVLDSIFVRTLVISNGAKKVAIVSVDLLIMPPAVMAILEQKLPEGFTIDNVYPGATHTHNSIGNWGEDATRFIYGAFDEAIVNFIADQIAKSIKQASANMLAGNLSYGAIPVPQAVDNRLIRGGEKDDLMRVMEVVRSDSSRLLLMSYTAHATCLFSRDLMLSRDYPGALVDTMENKGYDFAMFMAGAVGSHKGSPPEFGETCIGWMAHEISSTYLSNVKHLQPVTDTALYMLRVPLPLSDPQVKILPDWKVRSWLFRMAFGEYPVSLTMLRVGGLIFAGVPADLSGAFSPALDSAAAVHQLHVIPTSFNGGYIGYLTPERHYDVDHYETQLMNWYAPGTGEYVANGLADMMEVISR